MKLSQPRFAHDVLHAEVGVQDPLPDQAGDDEGQREGIEEDGAEGVLEADLLVEQRGQQEADDQREDQRQDAVDQQVLDRDQPLLVDHSRSYWSRPTKFSRGSSLELVKE